MRKRGNIQSRFAVALQRIALLQLLPNGGELSHKGCCSSNGGTDDKGKSGRVAGSGATALGENISQGEDAYLGRVTCKRARHRVNSSSLVNQ